jgi:hypothetical protein
MVTKNQNVIAEQGGVKVVHLRFEGRSLDVPQTDLDVGTASSDAEVKRALARHLATPDGDHHREGKHEHHERKTQRV